MTWPFGDLPPLSYDLIVIDPPWRFRTWSETNQAKSPSRHYELMHTEDIMALPVGRLAQRDCVLLCWATGAMYPHALDCVKAWGFEHKSQMIWRKVTAAGKSAMGTGYWSRSMHEPVIIATMGKPTKIRGFPSLFDGVRREHSRKPDEFYEMVERHSIGIRRADLFSRQSRKGWDGFGFETGKFDDLLTPVVPAQLVEARP